jgi:hypothetical protein
MVLGLYDEQLLKGCGIFDVGLGLYDESWLKRLVAVPVSTLVWLQLSRLLALFGNGSRSVTEISSSRNNNQQNKKTKHTHPHRTKQIKESVFLCLHILEKLYYRSRIRVKVITIVEHTHHLTWLLSVHCHRLECERRDLNSVDFDLMRSERLVMNSIDKNFHCWHRCVQTSFFA